LERKFYAAKASFPIREVCARLEERLALRKFPKIEVDVEAGTRWEYASSGNKAITLTVTQLVKSVNPATHRTMWDAPDKNYQFIVTLLRDSDTTFERVAQQIGLALESRLEPYPTDWKF
jgi:hypothetical protein